MLYIRIDIYLYMDIKILYIRYFIHALYLILSSDRLEAAGAESDLDTADDVTIWLLVTGRGETH